MAGTETTIFDHESRLAGLEVSLKSNTDATNEIKADVKEIVGLIKGTNGDGITTRIALNKQSIGRIWWIVGPMALAIVIAAVGKFV